MMPKNGFGRESVKNHEGIMLVKGKKTDEDSQYETPPRAFRLRGGVCHPGRWPTKSLQVHVERR